jgi:hypothetical protein
MNTKKIVTIVLLLFVIVSVVFLIAKEFAFKQTGINLSQDETFITQGIDRNPDTTKITLKKNPQAEDRKIVVYYFHRTMRCATCIKLEEYSDEAIKSGFTAQLKNGKLQWKIVNIEDAGNEHYENDYKLYSQSLVLVELQNGKQQRWKNLEKIWELVGMKEVYLHYVQEEVKSYLEGNT